MALSSLVAHDRSGPLASAAARLSAVPLLSPVGHRRFVSGMAGFNFTISRDRFAADFIITWHFYDIFTCAISFD